MAWTSPMYTVRNSNANANTGTKSSVLDYVGAIIPSVSDILLAFQGKPATVVQEAPAPEREEDKTLMYAGIGFLAIILVIVIVLVLKK